MRLSTENKWGIGLMLVGVALGVFIGKVIGAVCGLVGIALILHACIRPKETEPLKITTSAKPDMTGEGGAALGFVLEVAGSQALDRENCDWQFYLTNCMPRIVRSVELYNVRSDVGAFELGFHEIPVMRPGEKLLVVYEVSARRIDGPKRATLWDFGNDHTGARGSSFIWYDILVKYREADDETERTGGFVAVCFDLQNKKLKTEGAEYYRKDRINNKIFPYS
jgi:hypothetical protein